MPSTSTTRRSGKDRGELRLVVVAGNTHDRRQRRELLHNRDRAEVTGVENQVGLRQPPQTLVRQPASSTRQVGVGDDGELHAAG